MNKKIQELADQADEFADNKTQMPGEYHPDWHDIRDQKFAESIINEIELYIEESEGDTDYLRFLIDKRLKNYTVEYNVNR